MKKLYAPLGYKLIKDVDIENEAQVREFCISLSDDKEMVNKCNEESLEDILKMLTDNGFEIEEK